MDVVGILRPSSTSLVASCVGAMGVSLPGPGMAKVFGSDRKTQAANMWRLADGLLNVCDEFIV